MCNSARVLECIACVFFHDHDAPARVDADCFFLSVVLQTGKTVTSVSSIAGGKFSIKVEKRTIDYVECAEVDYLMIASGSSEQVASDFQLFCSLFFPFLFLCCSS